MDSWPISSTYMCIPIIAMFLSIAQKMLLTVVLKLYRVIVLLEYFDLLLCIANLTGQDPQL